MSGHDWIGELVWAVNDLSEIVESPVLRIVVTVASVTLLATIGFLTKHVQDELRDQFGNTVADILTVVIIGSTVSVASVVILGVWESADDIARSMRQLPVGEEDVDQLLITVLIVLLTHIASRLVGQVLQDYLATTDAFSDHQRRLTYRLSQVFLWTGATIVVLGIWNVQLTGLLVGAGFAGIVVGMAARQTLGSVLAGFVLMFSRPFEIGDWVEVDDAEGTVTDISIVNTRIQTFDGEYVMIPNDVVSSEQITNRSRKGRLRLEVDVGVDYDADVDRAIEIADEAVDDLDEILAVPTPQVVAKQFGDSAVLLGVRFWIDKPSARRMWRARTAVVTALKSSFEAEGIEIPFPQRTLSDRAEGSNESTVDVAEPQTSDGPRSQGGDE